jgi:hypothetical protein
MCMMVSRHSKKRTLEVSRGLIYLCSEENHHVYIYLRNETPSFTIQPRTVIYLRHGFSPHEAIFTKYYTKNRQRP